MNHYLVALRDIKANNIMNVHIVPTHSVAVREIMDAVNHPDEKNILYKHPEDFELLSLGTIDIQTGVIDQSAKQRIALCVDFKQNVQ